MHQVLLEDLMICQSNKNDITEQLGNSDDYIGLKISANAIILDDTLHLSSLLAYYALSFLSKHTACQNQSPSLIQAAISGIDSVLDLKWIAAILPGVAKR